jgi:L-alanine-DL-glutamate epimerase-like enolase superfamily enzyme
MMLERSVSRRHFIGASAVGALAGASAVTNPAHAAAQAAGVKPADLPDLTIKEVKVYVIDLGPSASRVTIEAYNRIASIVTRSGIEGNYTLPSRYFHLNGINLGWLEYAKAALPGKSVLDLPALTSQYDPQIRRVGRFCFEAAIDNCLWDILGKAVGLPIYRILGAYRDRVLAYASSQHLKTVEDYVADVQRVKAEGFRAYKIHPPTLPGNVVDYRLDIEVAKAVRKAAGDGFPLLFDRVGTYNRYEAIVVGRVLDELKYIAYEDPIPTSDIDGCVELCQALDVPIVIGEFLYSPYNYAEYIRRGALDVVRFVVDNVGGITGGMKIARLAELFGMECAPHNWGETLDLAAHFHCELAMPNSVWFEMTLPQGIGDRPYIKDRIRIAKDGYVYAPTKPGLGYEIDYDVLDKMTKEIER